MDGNVDLAVGAPNDDDERLQLGRCRLPRSSSTTTARSKGRRQDQRHQRRAHRAPGELVEQLRLLGWPPSATSTATASPTSPSGPSSTIDGGTGSRRRPSSCSSTPMARSRPSRRSPRHQGRSRRVRWPTATTSALIVARRSATSTPTAGATSAGRGSRYDDDGRGTCAGAAYVLLFLNAERHGEGRAEDRRHGTGGFGANARQRGIEFGWSGSPGVGDIDGDGTQRCRSSAPGPDGDGGSATGARSGCSFLNADGSVIRDEQKISVDSAGWSDRPPRRRIRRVRLEPSPDALATSTATARSTSWWSGPSCRRRRRHRSRCRLRPRPRLAVPGRLGHRVRGRRR